jgi:dihydroflavonol-4-reductase
MNTQQKTSCLVLGATGFIGGNIARAALENGYRVRGFRRNPNSTGHLGTAPIQWVQGDLTDFDSLLAAMQGVDVVFHSAGFYPTRSKPREVPAQVTYASEEIKRVLQAARQANVGRFIYTSSLTTIGTSGRRI